MMRGPARMARGNSAGPTGQPDRPTGVPGT
jgi:hypothetical protein